MWRTGDEVDPPVSDLQSMFLFCISCEAAMIMDGTADLPNYLSINGMEWSSNLFALRL